MAKKREYSHFFFCLGLRTGVIISSILWIIEGISLGAMFLMSIVKPYRRSLNDTGEEITSIYYYINDLSVILSLYFMILTLISMFGLFSVVTHKPTRFLRMYSYISWFFAVFINSVLVMVVNIAMFVSKNEYINYCKEVRGKTFDDCYESVNSVLLWMGIVLFFQSFLHFYFSTILRTYVKNCTQLEKHKKKQKKLFNVPPKHSSAVSPSDHPGVFSIKVDKALML